MPKFAAFKSVVNFLIPPHCVSCHTPLESDQGLCGPCWSRIAFISQPYCDCCGMPLPYSAEVAQGILCGSCSLERPHYDKTRSAVAYDKASKDLILRFKHGDQTALAPFFNRWLIQAAQTLPLDTIDGVLPIPLHWTRLLKRGYNQAALLASRFAKDTDLTYFPNLLKRHRATASQGHLSNQERRDNVARSFLIAPKDCALIKGKNLLLIDDVFTSGATVEACTQTLKAAGAARVYVLTIARVVRG